LTAVLAPNAATLNNEVACAAARVIPVAHINPGTMRKPPPIPKNPAATPTPAPDAATRGAMSRFRRTPGSPSPFLEDNIAKPTIAMATAKASSRWRPSIALATDEPTQAAAAPVTANTVAQGQRTRPARAWPASAVRAFSDTPAAETPIATWGSRTPTT